jgi:hypothetical protein
MKQLQRMPVSVIIWICIFYGTILFVGINSWRDAGPIRSTLTLILFIVVVIHSYMIRHGGLQNLPIIRRNKNVLFMTGVMATAEGQLEEEWGGQESLTIAIRKEDCPAEEWGRLPGVKGFFACMSGMVHMVITRRQGIIKELKGANCEANEGAFIIYSGVDKDKPVMGLNEEIEADNKYMHSVIKKINTVVQTAISETSRDTQAGRKSTADVIHEIAPMIRELSQKPMIIQPPLPQQPT